MLVFLKLGAKNESNLLKLGAKNEPDLLKLGAKSNSDASLIKRLQAGLSSFLSLSYIAIVICFYLKEYAAD